jgi:hypothetical protein
MSALSGLQGLSRRKGGNGLHSIMAMRNRPIERFLSLLLWQAQQDRATELVIGVPASAQSGTPIRYRVQGTWFNFSPPPAQLHAALIAELSRVAGFSQNDRYPKMGVVNLPSFTGPLKWNLLINQPGGECSLRSLTP